MILPYRSPDEGSFVIILTSPAEDGGRNVRDVQLEVGMLDMFS